MADLQVRKIGERVWEIRGCAQPMPIRRIYGEFKTTEDAKSFAVASGYACHDVTWRLEIRTMRRKLLLNSLTHAQAVDLILNIQDALGTEECGHTLVEIARNAHKAEQELAAAKALQERLNAFGKREWDDHERRGIERAKAEGRLRPGTE